MYPDMNNVNGIIHKYDFHHRENVVYLLNFAKNNLKLNERYLIIHY